MPCCACVGCDSRFPLVVVVVEVVAVVDADEDDRLSRSCVRPCELVEEESVRRGGARDREWPLEDEEGVRAGGALDRESSLDGVVVGEWVRSGGALEIDSRLELEEEWVRTGLDRLWAVVDRDSSSDALGSAAVREAVIGDRVVEFGCRPRCFTADGDADG